MANTPHDTGPKQTREERLAANLRANLKRRKVQAKALETAKPDAPLSNSEPCG
jgi:hypothetical protein